MAVLSRQIPYAHDRSPTASHVSQNLVSSFNQILVQSSADPNSFNEFFNPAIGLSNSGFLLKQGHNVEAISYFQQRDILPNQIGVLNCKIVMPQQQSYGGWEAGMPNTGSTNSFLLKWLVGTNISRCYGCGGAIPNPHQDVPDDSVIVYRDFRRYRDRQTGHLQCTGAPQNVRSHLVVLVSGQDTPFMGSLLIVPMEFTVCFCVEHISELLSKFGWTPSAANS